MLLSIFVLLSFFGSNVRGIDGCCGESEESNFLSFSSLVRVRSEHLIGYCSEYDDVRQMKISGRCNVLIIICGSTCLALPADIFRESSL